MNTCGQTYSQEENLALRPGVTVAVSVPNPTGRGARDPSILLNETAYHLDGQPLSTFLRYRDSTYDTYDGHNPAKGPDWYAITFPELTTFNCVDMTMECAHRDGGWWTSLWIEIQVEPGGDWRPVKGLEIKPAYEFDDVAYGRKPYETFALIFDEVSANAVRIIGQPGGLAQFTSLARLAVYHRDLFEWDESLLPPPQTPYVFRLIHPKTIWDLSESLVKLTGLAFGVQSMDHYLDKERYERWWKRISRNYLGEPELWILVGALVGWDEYFKVGTEHENFADSPKEPYVRIAFHNTLACAVAPIVVDNQVQAEITSHTVILSGTFDEKWHRRYARDHDISWAEYMAAVNRSPHMSYEQLEGAAILMGMIANTITNLAHLNLGLRKELQSVHQTDEARIQERKILVEKAIRFMRENVETEVSVAEVAQAVALSPTYFGLLFKEETGRTPLRYFNDLRIERAKQYLIYSVMSVLDISTMLGYNPNYFSRFFKQYTGHTPSEFRDKMRTT